MNKELIIIILAPIIMGLIMWYQDKKKKEQELSDRLYNAENNITHLNNLNNRKRYKWTLNIKAMRLQYPRVKTLVAS